MIHLGTTFVPQKNALPVASIVTQCRDIRTIRIWKDKKMIISKFRETKHKKDVQKHNRVDQETSFIDIKEHIRTIDWTISRQLSSYEQDKNFKTFRFFTTNRLQAKQTN